MDRTTSRRTAEITLPADDQILITRTFNAPRHLVYRAWTSPDLVKRWWSGGHGEVTTADIDLRVGGTWRYVMVVEGGGEVAFHGEFREIVPDEKIVNTEVFEDGSDGPGALNTVTFTEAGGQTTLTMLVEAPDRATRDAIMESGMEEGMQSGWDLLEQLAVSLR